MKYDCYGYKPPFGKKYNEPLKRILESTRLYWDHAGVPPHVRAAFRKVVQCRTPALGAEVYESENGRLIVYHTCKPRACPSCGYWATKKWIPERVAALPPVPYIGITFSMPDVLWRVFSQNRILADALPALAANAIESLISAKHGLRTGVIAFLHTFNGKLEFNSHVHTMATAGGWRISSGSWVPSVYYHPDILMRLWRGAVLDLLRTALRADRLRTTMTADEPVPVDLVTTSGSGLDPHITPAAAEFQVARVAKARGISEENIRKLLNEHIEARQFGFLGEPRVNVLALNLALDEMHPGH